MYKIRRKLFSQNFLYNRKLITQLLGSSSIDKTDLVLEIGPGNGSITEQLVTQAQHVLAVEIDSHWYRYLQEKFNSVENLTLYQDDFLNYKLPILPYKVFANIPFAIEGKIIRKLIDAKNPPYDCFLVMMKELAYRLAAPYRENMFSIIHKPWFEFSILYHFKRTDFTPRPSVDAVMLRFTKRKQPLIPWQEKERFQSFVQKGFAHGTPLGVNFKRQFGYTVTKRILNTVGINKHIKPSYLSLTQWIQLYNAYKNTT